MTGSKGRAAGSPAPTKPATDPTALPKVASGRLAVVRQTSGADVSKSPTADARRVNDDEAVDALPLKSPRSTPGDLKSIAGRRHRTSAPTVVILTPVSRVSIAKGTPVILAAAARDAEDGDMGRTVTWHSSLDGKIATGANTYATLTPGTHRITASVTDTHGATARSVITVTVTGAR